jgi:hypothetical protein
LTIPLVDSLFRKEWVIVDGVRVLKVCNVFFVVLIHAKLGNHLFSRAMPVVNDSTYFLRRNSVTGQRRLQRFIIKLRYTRGDAKFPDT